MEKMTIIYLHPHFTLPGGAGKFVLETGQRLAQKGHQVIVVSIRADKKIVASYTGIQFKDFGGPLSSSIWFWLSFPLVLVKVFRILDTYPDSIIFPQVFPANWWGFLYKRFRPQSKVVWMCQEPSAFIHSSAWIHALPWSIVKLILIITLPLLKLIDIYLGQFSNYIFCNSNFTLAQAKSIYGFTDRQAQTLYLGSDLNTFRPLKKARQLKIVVICRLTKFKRVDTILKALSRLNQNRLSPISLTVIGDGEEKKNLEKLAKDLELQNQVSFWGHEPDITKVVAELSSARAFVQASIGEPFGLAPIEAMACGTPAVVSDSGGMTETVIDGKTGFHFKGGDEEDLCQVLIPLMENDALFKHLSTQAVERAKFFTWEKTTETIEQTFHELS